MVQEVPQKESASAVSSVARTTRKVVWWVLTTLVVIAVVIASWVGIVILQTGQAPEPAQKAVENVNAAITDLKHAANEATGGTPTIYMGAEGGPVELEYCDGTFTEYVTYRNIPDLQPLFLAHNGCSGDVLLPLQVGDVINIVERDQSTVEYRVVDMRDTRQFGENTDSIAGMGGELLFQTCYWDNYTMKFVGVEKVQPPEPVKKTTDKKAVATAEETVEEPTEINLSE